MMDCCCCFTCLAIVITLLIILKVIIKLTTRWDRSPTCLVGKTALVTGANTGIGFYTAQDFAKRGAKVILACRNNEKAEQARNNIINATNNPNVFIKLVDFSSLQSIRDFAQDINSTEERLDILVNNAGAGDLGESVSCDGLVELLQVNYFAPFLLTNLLISLLKKSTPSRIVNVASHAFILSKLDINNLNSQNRSRNYGNSKLLNILFGCELARKLEGSGVVSNCVHPGIVKTELFRNIPKYAKIIIKLLQPFIFKSAEEGAQTSIYVSVAKHLETVSGEYFDNCRLAWMFSKPKESLDIGFTKKVWEKSEEIVKLTNEERQL